ncbi:diaminopimelate epimerase [Salinimicrobium oceani]|uniref:Diaminopimelate epimerase n=1 Tax=Salinimicrobium oceani TaxID=2722702 RepID=A0ABX1CYK6_9FLAO|nr:diaminopimelate epimerase [Salinimicrobium oceani]NJW51488.1 diaminopimelate epimerase [Salinimicrobium oceani]
MKLGFYKYQGTGNDFVMFDNRSAEISKNDTKLIRNLCDRRFGVGADGLILLEHSNDPQDDFKMVYFNADGNESSMCGNGGRCLVAFAAFLGIIKSEARFSAIDGVHEAVIENELVGLKMMNVDGIRETENAIFINTGSPHHVIFSESITEIDIRKEGAAVRYSDAYKETGGTNVNFVSQIDDATYSVRTYERGVEDETLSCGTGVTAVALAVSATKRSDSTTIHLETLGGQLAVKFKPEGTGFKDIWLTGPAKQVFKGEINW